MDRGREALYGETRRILGVTTKKGANAPFSYSSESSSD
jgi:hypothetical protein